MRNWVRVGVIPKYGFLVAAVCALFLLEPAVRADGIEPNRQNSTAHVQQKTRFEAQAERNPLQTKDTDLDGDGTPDSLDECPFDVRKSESGSCGCGAIDEDFDGDGIADCYSGCERSPERSDPACPTAPTVESLAA